MKLETIKYKDYELELPKEGNHVIGQILNGNIVVYQAFNNEIANYAISNQKFGGKNYSFSRMTWIKPNFLWMMYRSGWASKENQNRILAIELSFDYFEQVLENGIFTRFYNEFESEHSWKQKLLSSDIRIQWDPDHNFKGEKLNRKAIQIGLKGDALKDFNDIHVKSIDDITEFVNEQKNKIDRNENDFYVIKENVIQIKDSIKEKLLISL